MTRHMEDSHMSNWWLSARAVLVGLAAACVAHSPVGAVLLSTCVILLFSLYDTRVTERVR